MERRVTRPTRMHEIQYRRGRLSCTEGARDKRRNATVDGVQWARFPGADIRGRVLRSSDPVRTVYCMSTHVEFLPGRLSCAAPCSAQTHTPDI